MYNPVSLEQKKYTVRDGLSHSFIYSVIADSHDNIWITSEGGLTRFNTADKSFRNYDQRDGLINNHFDDKSDSKLADGSIYLGTNYGFTIFKPDAIKDDTSKSQIVLTNLSINNEPVKFYTVGRKRKEKQIPIDEIQQIDL